jgi:methylated-DNA-[protein]-cysteine S-methyltransferase
MQLFRERVPSPIGTILLVSDGEALHALDFEDFEDRALRLLERYHGPCELVPGRAAGVAERLAAYFAGELTALDAIPVQTGGTKFQRRVWRALRDIPAGSTMSYGRLAAALGAPTASRAVGLANGANPVALVLPCHRVIGANGSLTGYGGGLSRKAWLLRHETGIAADGLWIKAA